MATVNPFDLPGDDDTDDLSKLILATLNTFDLPVDDDTDDLIAAQQLEVPSESQTPAATQPQSMPALALPSKTPRATLADVFADVISIDQVRAEEARFVTANPAEPWKKPKVVVKFYHASWSSRSKELLPHFTALVYRNMITSGHEIRHLAYMIAEGRLKPVVYDDKISSFPTITVMTKDKVWRVSLKEMKGDGKDFFFKAIDYILAAKLSYIMDDDSTCYM